MYDVGILGGMGTKATANLYEKIIDYTNATVDQEYLNIAIMNKASIPDRTEYLLDHTKENPLNDLKKGIEELNMIGATWIAIPCNTSHFFIENMERYSKYPIINMIEYTLKYIQLSSECKNICILGTLGTVKFRIYDKFKSENMNIVYPNETDCKRVHKIIYKVKNGEVHDFYKLVREIEDIMQTVLEHCGSVVFVLACTELSVLFSKNITLFKIVDAMDVLALLSVAVNGKLRKNIEKYDVESIKKLSKELKTRYEE